MKQSEKFGDDMKKFLERMLLQYRELIVYAICGVLTTIVNYAIYFACTKLFSVHYLVSNVIAWVFSVIFAYLVNKIYVFASLDWSRRKLLKEIWQFAAARIFSGVAETLMLLVLVDMMGFRDSVIKIIAGILVIVMNYLFSKWVIFKKA